MTGVDMAVSQQISIPIVTIIVYAVLGVCVLSGALKGFVRKISGIAAFLLAGILMTALLPYVSSWLHTTPVYDFIRQQCESVGTGLVKNSIAKALGTGTGAEPADGNGTISSGIDASAVIDSVTQDDGSGKLDRSKIKAQLQAVGYDPSVIDNLSDAELEGYVQQFLGATAGMILPASFAENEISWGTVNHPFPLLSVGGLAVLSTGNAQEQYGNSSAELNGGADLLSQITSGMDRIEQTKFIESLPLPQMIRDQIETFNNEDGYMKLGATDFGSYIINYFASLIMNILTYIVTILITWIILWVVMTAMSLFTHLPIVGTADHLLGLAAGLVQGLMIVWGLFLVLSLFSTTEAGTVLMNEVNRSAFLSLLYDRNPFLAGAAGVIKGIM